MSCAMEVGMRDSGMFVVHLIRALARRRIPYATILNVDSVREKE